MGYSVDFIVPVNINLAVPGLQYANFVTVRAIGTQSMLADGATFPADTFRSYGQLTDVAEDFDTASDVYLIASNWFSQTPRVSRESFQVWMWDDVTDTNFIDTLNKAEDAAPWRFFVVPPITVYQNDQATALAIAAWASANAHIIPLTFSNPDNLDETIDTDIPTALLNDGSRYITQKFRSPSLITTSALYSYSAVAELTYFQRFNFDSNGASSVDPEYAPLSNVAGEPDTIRDSQYAALKNKRLGFYAPIELKGEQTSARVIGSWTTSSFNETVDDVFSIEVLKNRLQVDGFNYISARKRGLRRPRDYAGYLSDLSAVCKQANVNGTLASDAVVTDPRTGEDVVLRDGFLILSQPEDVRDLTSAQIAAREYPPVEIIVVLARSARVAQINVNVE